MSEAQVQTKESLFSKKNRRLLTDPINDNNPITVQVLGICSALAVTAKVEKAFVMALCVTVITAMSNLVISAIRKGIPGRIRMIVQLVVIAALVSLVELMLQAFSYSMYKELSVFVGLIITNCILMGRLEAFAMANKPWPSFLDGIGNGLGYGAILIVVAIIREFFGSGSFFGITLLSADTAASFGYEYNNLMVLPASSMFVIGLLIWAHRAWNKSLVDVS